MIKDCPIFLLDKFPDFSSPQFDLKAYKAQFITSNSVIRAKSMDVEYGSNSWGALSIKFALGGTEYYESKNGCFGVNDGRYFVLNRHTIYSSYIKSDQEVESFTISFSPKFESDVVCGLLTSEQKMLDDPLFRKENEIEYSEMLYEHNSDVSPILLNIYYLSTNWQANKELISEQLTFLLEGLTKTQMRVLEEVKKVRAIKSSTQKELFIRLHRAKDFIHSTYPNQLSLKDIAGVACLNPYYFLREFKKLFGTTPNQCLQRVRLQEANRLLKTTNRMVHEICSEVGFADHASFTKLYKRHFNFPPTEGRSAGVD